MTYVLGGLVTSSLPCRPRGESFGPDRNREFECFTAGRPNITIEINAMLMIVLGNNVIYNADA